MQLHIISVGTRMPQWVDTACNEYAKRLPPHCRFRIREIAAGRRTRGSDITRVLRDEGERILAALPKDCYVIALERTGRQIDTICLAEQMQQWLSGGRDIALLIGGPEGLSPECLERADTLWSLSALTLAHPVVRIVLAEQLYRAWSILDNRPYHRGN
jgi:23S rRNA (pseudouridine1915-N3)-methyltransferase